MIEEEKTSLEKDKCLSLETKLHGVLSMYLDARGLSPSEQNILIEDIKTAIDNRIKVFSKTKERQVYVLEAQVLSKQPY